MVMSHLLGTDDHSCHAMLSVGFSFFNRNHEVTP